MNDWAVLGLYLVGSSLLVSGMWVGQGTATGLALAGCMVILLAAVVWDEK